MADGFEGFIPFSFKIEEQSPIWAELYSMECKKGGWLLMRRKPCCKFPCRPNYLIAFGLGLMLSCFCPSGLLFFLISVVLVWIGISLLRFQS